MVAYAYYGIAIVAVGFYAILPVIIKKVGLSVPPLTFIAVSMAVLSLLSFAASLIVERSFPWSDIKPYHFGLLVLFGVVNLIGFFLYIKAVNHIPIAHYQLIGSIGPVVAAGLAFIFLGETITARFFFALPFVVIGLYIALMK